MSIRVLLVEDDDEFRESLQSFLFEAGLDVCAVGDAAGLAREMQKAAPDVVILDLNLPDTDGLSAALTMRETSSVGIIVLTGRTQKQDRIQGLAIGVDHYLTKPTDPAELELVIRNLHRRLGGPAPTSAPAPAPARELAPWMFHAKKWLLESPSGHPVILSGMELQILDRLIASPGKPVSRIELMRHAGRPDTEDAGRGLDLIIFRLRRKVQKECGFALPLVSARGKGYVFAGEVILPPE